MFRKIGLSSNGFSSVHVYFKLTALDEKPLAREAGPGPVPPPCPHLCFTPSCFISRASCDWSRTILAATRHCTQPPLIFNEGRAAEFPGDLSDVSFVVLRWMDPPVGIETGEAGRQRGALQSLGSFTVWLIAIADWEDSGLVLAENKHTVCRGESQRPQCVTW